ncbi:MAG: YdeI/OmpD-associated family protein [Planctomycetota bacterium]|jgi:uncharacterized protein YdeI (YjbR/CyaY-like superfamily)
MQRAKSVDQYLKIHPEWKAALVKLRKILEDTELEETVKWGAPCYTVEGKNIVGIGAFKEYVGLWFHQGALLSDPDKVLINAQDGKTKALRQWRFASDKEIKVTKLKAYLKEAIANQKQGKEIKADRSKPVIIPAELKTALAKKPRAKKAFDAMTKGKQREYADHISSAKRDETKQTRLKKILPMIQAGGGLHDKYRNC